MYIQSGVGCDWCTNTFVCPAVSYPRIDAAFVPFTWIAWIDGCRPVLFSNNNKFSYGFSSLRGKRVSMEDFHDTKIAEVEGKMVGLFGVFDGQCFYMKFCSLYCQMDTNVMLFQMYICLKRCCCIAKEIEL